MRPRKVLFLILFLIHVVLFRSTAFQTLCTSRFPPSLHLFVLGDAPSLKHLAGSDRKLVVLFQLHISTPVVDGVKQLAFVEELANSRCCGRLPRGAVPL